MRRHVLLGQKTVSSAKAWAFRKKYCKWESNVQYWETSSHVHPVKWGFTAETYRSRVKWFSIRAPCSKEAWAQKKDIRLSQPFLLHGKYICLITVSHFAELHAPWFALNVWWHHPPQPQTTVNWHFLRDFTGFVTTMPFGIAASFSKRKR